jgi:hypothetical protein
MWRQLSIHRKKVFNIGFLLAAAVAFSFVAKFLISSRELDKKPGYTGQHSRQLNAR